MFWETEQGLSGGDELNILRAGRNYGRPLVSYGRDYLESPVSTHPFLEGMENPIVVWLPSISVTGMTFYTGELFPTGNGTCSSAVSARAAFRGSDNAFIVVEHAAQAASAQDRSLSVFETVGRKNEPIARALMISIGMVTREELPHHVSERALSKQDHPFQARLLDGTHKPFCVAVQVWRAWRKLYGSGALVGQCGNELGREQRVADMDKIPLTPE